MCTVYLFFNMHVLEELFPLLPTCHIVISLCFDGTLVQLMKQLFGCVAIIC